jgi:hypothetical protein
MHGIALINPLEMLESPQQPPTGQQMTSNAVQAPGDKSGTLSSFSAVDFAPLEWLAATTSLYSSGLIPSSDKPGSAVRGPQGSDVQLAALLSAPGLVLHRRPPPACPPQPAASSLNHPAVQQPGVHANAWQVPGTAPASHADAPVAAAHTQHGAIPSTEGPRAPGVTPPSAGWVSRNPGPLHQAVQGAPHTQQAAGRQWGCEEQMVEEGQAEQEEEEEEVDNDSMSEDLTGTLWGSTHSCCQACQHDTHSATATAPVSQLPACCFGNADPRQCWRLQRMTGKFVLEQHG